MSKWFLKYIPNFAIGVEWVILTAVEFAQRAGSVKKMAKGLDSMKAEKDWETSSAGRCPPENSLQLTNTMNDPQSQQHGGAHPQHRPYWKRVHHSPFFWLSALLILIAMIIYVTTENLAFRPGQPPQHATPAIAP